MGTGKGKRTALPKTVAATSKKPKVQHDDKSIPKAADIHEAVEFAPLNKVVEKLEFLDNFLQVLSNSQVDCLKALLSAPRTIKTENGAEWTSGLIHCYAHDRYDLDEQFYSTDQKRWLRSMTEQEKHEDAVHCLNLLASYGVEVLAKASDGQTALHMAMANGYTNVVRALLENVDFTLKDLNQLDDQGENPFSAALENGQYDCAALLLEKVPLETALYLEDGEGNNTLALLSQYCNVNYHADDFDPEDLTDPTLTLNLLRKVLEFVKSHEMIDVLVHKNRYDENPLHVAARCGNFLEIQEFLCLDFGCGKSVADCFSNGMTPLDRIIKTRQLVLNEAPIERFEKELAIYGLQEPIKNDRTLSNWLHNSIEPAVEILEHHRQRKTVSLDHALQFRPGSKSGNAQELSPATLQLQSTYFKHKRVQNKTKFVYPNGTNADVKAQIEELYGKTAAELQQLGRKKTGVVKDVELFQIRDPSDPCLRSNTYALSRQYGIRANDRIPANVVVGEYVGNIHREGESAADWSALPSYGFGVEALDAVVKKHKPDGSDKAYTLDAQKFCNETAFINDSTTNFLTGEEEDDVGAREANVAFLQILIDEWPHIYIIAKVDIEPWEELLVKYGHAYWERLRNHHLLTELSATRGLAKERLFDSSSDGDFESTPLGTGKLVKLRWSGSSKMSPGEMVTPNAYQLGVGDKLTKTLLEYCSRKMITARARRITIGGGTLDCGMEEVATMGGHKWTIQRHSSHNESNLQWIAPANEASHNDFLQALSAGGFDRILQSIGTALGFQGLAIYQTSFICVSFCRDGRLHFDLNDTGGRAFNIIIPLILADEKVGPELEIQPFNDTSYPPTVGDYRYKLNTAILLGDDAIHATGRVDYAETREFRLAASVYVADIRKENIRSLEDSYTQFYRPNNGDLLSLAGAHWRNVGGVKLPKLGRNHVLKKR